MSAKRCLFRSVSVVLLVIMAVGCLPSGRAFAAPAGKPPKEVKRVRELSGLRTARSKTYLNEDGTRTAEIGASTIHAKDSAGRWVDLDYKVSRKGNAFIAGDGEVRVSLSAALTNRTAIVTDGKRTLSMGMSAGKPRKQASKAGVIPGGAMLASAGAPDAPAVEAVKPRDVAAVQVDDYTLEYRGVFSGIDLRYTVTRVGFKEEIVIKDLASVK